MRDVGFGVEILEREEELVEDEFRFRGSELLAIHKVGVEISSEGADAR